MEQPKNVRQKRKRRFMLDEQRNISGDDMKANMSDYRLENINFRCKII